MAASSSSIRTAFDRAITADEACYQEIITFRTANWLSYRMSSDQALDQVAKEFLSGLFKRRSQRHIIDKLTVDEIHSLHSHFYGRLSGSTDAVSQRTVKFAMEMLFDLIMSENRALKAEAIPSTISFATEVTTGSLKAFTVSEVTTIFGNQRYAIKNLRDMFGVLKFTGRIESSSEHICFFATFTPESGDTLEVVVKFVFLSRPGYPVAVFPFTVAHAAQIQSNYNRISTFLRGSPLRSSIKVNDVYILTGEFGDLWCERVLPGFKRFWATKGPKTQRMLVTDNPILQKLQIAMYTEFEDSVVDLQGDLINDVIVLTDIEFLSTLVKFGVTPDEAKEHFLAKYRKK